MRRAERIALGASFSLWIVYIFSLLLAYPKLLATLSINHFAAIDAIFPYLNLLAMTISLLCFVCALYRMENKYVQIELLIQLSLTLWVTPYFLSSYIMGHDILYHGGVSIYAPQALAGSHTYFSDYLEDYPMSFILNWIFMNVTTIDLPVYSRLIFPAFASMTYVVLMYSLASRFFERRIAFLSVCLTILGLYYVEIQMAPQTVGVMLVLTSVLLIFRSDLKSKILALLPISLLIGTHPESPLLLSVFLVASFVAARITHDYNYRKGYSSFLILIIVGWLTWAFFHAVTMGGIPISKALVSIFQFAISLESTRTFLPNQTLFPLIGYLRTYFLYGYVLMYLGLLLTFLHLRALSSIPKLLKHLTVELGSGRVMFISCSAFFLLVAFFLRTSTGDLGINLVQRALFYFYLCMSIFIASSLIRMSSRNRSRAKLLLLLLVGSWIGSTAFVYPIASYYAVAYNSVPYSQVVGIEFLSHSTLESKRVFSYRPNDLAFVSRTESIEIVYQPQNASIQNLQGFVQKSLDVAVIQHDQYFYFADQDLSLSDNTFVRMNEVLINSPEMNMVYSNPSCQIFFRN